MGEWIRALVLRVMRVPHVPDPPEGSPESIQVFRAGRNYLRWRLIVWLLSQALIVAGFLLSILIVESLRPRFPAWVQTGVRLLDWAGFILLAATFFFTYFQQRLNYELRWYMVTDRSLRIRSGILSVQELTLTFANIQEIRVAASPLKVFLGLADVEVHTAGGGSGGVGSHGGHVGRFQGVDNANAIRDLIVERLRIYRDSGLGEHHVTNQPESHAVLEAARAVLTEVRAWRECLLKDPAAGAV